MLIEKAQKKKKRYTNRTSIVLSDKQIQYLKEEAEKYQVSMGDVIRFLISKAVEGRGE